MTKIHTTQVEEVTTNNGKVKHINGITVSESEWAATPIFRIPSSAQHTFPVENLDTLTVGNVLYFEVTDSPITLELPFRVATTDCNVVKVICVADNHKRGFVEQSVTDYKFWYDGESKLEVTPFFVPDELLATVFECEESIALFNL